MNPKMMWNCKNLSHIGYVCKAQNLCWSHAFTDGSLWQMPKPSEWLCGKVSHCSVFLCEMLFWIKGCWMSKYPLCILTFWPTYIGYYCLSKNKNISVQQLIFGISWKTLQKYWTTCTVWRTCLHTYVHSFLQFQSASLLKKYGTHHILMYDYHITKHTII